MALVNVYFNILRGATAIQIAGSFGLLAARAVCLQD